LHDCDFRGQLAAASLKPAGAAIVSLRVKIFPRPIGRGLIEATREYTWPVSVRLISAANWPRPH